MQGLLVSFDVLAVLKIIKPYFESVILIVGLWFVLTYVLALSPLYKGPQSRFLHRLAALHRIAPSVMTALGLLGTFIGLTVGFASLPDDFGSRPEAATKGLAQVVSELKQVFQYSLLGIAAAILFMPFSAWVGEKQRRLAQTAQLKRREAAQEVHESQQARQLAALEQSADELKRQRPAVEASAERMQKVEAAIAVQALKMDTIAESLTLASQALMKFSGSFDANHLAKTITDGITAGITPVFERIEQSLAKNGGEMIQQALAQMREEVLIPLAESVNRTNANTEKLIGAVEGATAGMRHTTDKMEMLTERMGNTVSAMEAFQGRLLKDMHDSQQNMQQILSGFNATLNENISRIQPAIESGMTKATDAMVEQITVATEGMTESVTRVMQLSADQMQDMQSALLTRFAESQDRLGLLFDRFGQALAGQLTALVGQIQGIGQHAHDLMNHAADNLRATLGNIDEKLLNTRKELELALERFRDEYSLRLDEFFTKQNTQLEQTIGEQRAGLSRVVQEINDAFANAARQQDSLNTSLRDSLQEVRNVQELISRMQAAITGAEGGVLAKIEVISLGLADATESFDRGLRRSAEELKGVNQALETLGQSLPANFTKSFEMLNARYVTAFSNLDEGLSKVAGRLQVATGALAGALNAFNAVKESR